MKQDIHKSILKEGELIPLNYDRVFINIFNNKDNIDILESFLACWFSEEQDYFKGKVKLWNRELISESKKEKDKQIDLLVEYNDKLINIELNTNIKKVGIIDRNVILACKVHGTRLKYSDNKYENIGYTIQINLNMSYKQERLIERYLLKNEEGKILTEKLEIDMLDMELGRKMCYDESSKYYKLARWCKVFTATEKEEFVKALGDDLMAKKSKEKLVDEMYKFSSDKKILQVYSKYSKQELEYNTLLSETKKLKKEKEQIEKEKEQIEKEKEQIEKEKTEIENENEKLVIKQNSIDKEIAISFYKRGVDKDIIKEVLNIDEEQLNKYLEGISI